MSDLPFHPLTEAPPHGRIWFRGAHRVYGDVPRTHSELVILVGLSGRARYLIDGQMLSFGRGGMIWALSGQAHMLVEDSDGFDMIIAVLHPALWEGQARPPVSVADLIPSQHQVLPRASVASLSQQALSELETLAQGLVAAEDAEVTRPGLQWFAHRAFTHWQASERSEGQGQALHPAVARVAMALQEDPSAELETLCQNAGLTRSRLGVLFRQQMGETPGAFRSRQRLRQVDVRVAGGGALLQAAFDAGYGSYSQFFRDFQRFRHTTPRAWYRLDQRS